MKQEEEEEASHNLQNQEGRPDMLEPVKEMLPVEERIIENEDEVMLDRNCIITDAFMTKCINRGPDYLQNRDPEMYDLPTGHYVGRM
jgi:hypothetical protein